MLVLLAGNVWAQPASITVTPAPVFGLSVFDAEGNQYFFQGGKVTAGAAQTQNGGGRCFTSNGFFSVLGPCTDGYAGKLDAAGKLVWGTFLGGSTADAANALAVDRDGNVFITGSTDGSFSTTVSAAIKDSTTAKAFAAKISADGSRVLYSTYLPETIATTAAIAVDGEGNAYVGGQTSGGHAVVLKINAEGSVFPYSASLAGSAQESISAMKADSTGYVTVAGETTSPDFPVTSGAAQSRLRGAQDVFIAELDPSGRVIFASYLGGSGSDAASEIETDAANNIYLVGRTDSLDFPTTAGSFEADPIIPMWNNSSSGGFATKLSADGSKLVWSTYVMSADNSLYGYIGPRFLGAAQLAVSASGEVYVAGVAGPGYPVSKSAPQICYDGQQSPAIYTGTGSANAFVVHLDSHGALVDATYAGRGVFYALGLSVTPDGTVLLISNDTAYPDTYVKSAIRFGGVGWIAPTCLSPAVLNAATLSTIPYSAKGPALVPGELITLTGFGIGPEAGVAAAGLPPLSLGGVQVLFDGQPAPLLYVQSRQINVAAPVELRGRDSTSITVVYNQTTFGSINASIVTYGFPGLFRLHPGQSSDTAAVNANGTINSASNPAVRGSVVSVWGTGFGLTEPACATGGINAAGPVNLTAGLYVAVATVTPPGVPVKGTPVLYAGGAPGLVCGVVQINFVVPTDVPAGAYLFFPHSNIVFPAGDESGVRATSSSTIWVK